MVYFMRHGQTDHNKENKWMGTLDIPLNGVGISQAYSSIENIKSLKIDIIYCSNLKRAIETSILIGNEINLPIIKDIRLNERFLGQLEGMIKNPELLQNTDSIESELSVFLRVKSFLEELPNNKNILIISHSALFKIILKHNLISSKNSIINNAQVVPINVLT